MTITKMNGLDWMGTGGTAMADSDWFKRAGDFVLLMSYTG